MPYWVDTGFKLQPCGFACPPKIWPKLGESTIVINSAGGQNVATMVYEAAIYATYRTLSRGCLILVAVVQPHACRQCCQGSRTHVYERQASLWITKRALDMYVFFFLLYTIGGEIHTTLPSVLASWFVNHLRSGHLSR